jgi:hypothetical protein
MVPHNFLSKHLAPLQDGSHRPAWMYSRVNDIMQLDRGLRSSLDDTLLDASLKALTTDPPPAELMTPTADCEPLSVNQAARTALLVIMPMLDDVDIAPVQRGDQSRGVVIHGPGDLSGAAGGHSHGGVPAGGGPAGSRSGISVGGRGGAASGSSAVALGKGKQARAILDDDEVSSDEDKPLQKRLRQLSGTGPAVHDEAAAGDKEVVTKQAAEEAIAKRATEEAVVKKAAEERATVEAATVEAERAAGGAPAPNQVPPAATAKRPAAPPHWLNVRTGVFGNFGLSSSLPFFFLLPFCPCPLPPAWSWRWAQLPQMRLSGRLRGRLLSVSLRPPKESLRMSWSPRGSRRRCQRWFRRRLQRRGP